MLYDVRVFIRLKDNVPDTNGQGMLSGLRSLGLSEGVLAVHTGKIIDLEVTSDSDHIDETVTLMCQELLTHPVIEQFEYRLVLHYAQNGTTLLLPLSRGEPHHSDAELIALRSSRNGI